jgi:hypothetical protein
MALSHIRVHVEPRITANDLARFMVSSDVVRLSIIRNSRETKDAMVVRYKYAREAITSFLTSVNRDSKILAVAEQMLEQRKNDTALPPFHRQDAALSLEALRSCRGMANLLGPIDFQPVAKRQKPIIIEGVEVSVNLNALVYAATKKKQLIGGAILRLTKADEKESEASGDRRKTMGSFVATIAYMHILENFKNIDGREASPAHCYSIDIQYGDVHSASSSVVRKIDNLKAACRIIKAMWKTA